MGGGGVAPGLQRATLHRSTHTVQFPVTARDSEYFQQDIKRYYSSFVCLCCTVRWYVDYTFISANPI